MSFLWPGWAWSVQGSRCPITWGHKLDISTYLEAVSATLHRSICSWHANWVRVSHNQNFIFSNLKRDVELVQERKGGGEGGGKGGEGSGVGKEIASTCRMKILREPQMDVAWCCTFNVRHYWQSPVALPISLSASSSSPCCCCGNYVVSTPLLPSPCLVELQT